MRIEHDRMTHQVPLFIACKFADMYTVKSEGVNAEGDDEDINAEENNEDKRMPKQAHFLFFKLCCQCDVSPTPGYSSASVRGCVRDYFPQQ